MILHLEICDMRGRRFELAFLPIVIGRSPACQVQLSDPWASRRHCRIEWLSQDASLVTYDLNSKNGTFLNGASVVEAKSSAPTRLAIGRSEIIVCQLTGAMAPFANQVLDSLDLASCNRQLDTRESMEATQLEGPQALQSNRWQDSR